MISIDKQEATVIREKVPSAHIVRTMKKKSKRHRYFCEETRAVKAVLRQMHGIEEPKRTRRPKRGGRKHGGFKPQARRVSA